MQYVLIALVAALVFGLCYLVDKAFTKLFRNQAQHMSGKAVRLNKRYGSIGIILVVIGIAAIFMGWSNGLGLTIGGGVVTLMGVGMIVYYMNYGVFYDEDSFIYMSMGKRQVTYAYGDICTQQLYNNQGHLLIELVMADGKAVMLQSTMSGCYDFMDHAFSAWCRQTGRKLEDCDFHDPANSCWFPPVNSEVA